MESVLYYVWGGAVVLILGLLLAILLSTRKRGPKPDQQPQVGPQPEPEPEPASVLSSDTLLFYHEEQSARKTADGRVVVLVPQTAWASEWQEDLLRIEVTETSPDPVALPSDWGTARVLRAYTLRAIRMTEMGNDVPVDEFPSPVALAIGADVRERGVLRCALYEDGAWGLPPRADIAQWNEVDWGGKPGWAGATLTRLGTVCLFQLPT